jgi:hypothetical protein
MPQSPRRGRSGCRPRAVWSPPPRSPARARAAMNGIGGGEGRGQQDRLTAGRQQPASSSPHLVARSLQRRRRRSELGNVRGLVLLQLRDRRVRAVRVVSAAIRARGRVGDAPYSSSQPLSPAQRTCSVARPPTQPCAAPPCRPTRRRISRSLAPPDGQAARTQAAVPFASCSAAPARRALLRAGSGWRTAC